MADPKGFLTTPREIPVRRPVDLRLLDWREVYEPFPPGRLERQAGRCMDCGIPFCHNGCPLGNLIPEWNDLVWRHDWRDAADRLHATNNFPEFTGRLCPAPCEAACVLGINADPVTIKQVEVEIIDRAFASGWVVPMPPAVRTGRTVAVIGSGPAGLAAAQQLTRAGHAVTVFERDDAPGGLLRYGIPAFKLEKRHLDRRLDQMRAEGTEFRCGVEAGTDVSAETLRSSFDADRAGGGARVPRDLPMPGRELDGIHQAMEYLPLSNRVVAADPGDAGRPGHQRARAARGHHRRRRHRRGLPGHRAPAGRGLGDPARDPAPAARDQARPPAVADLPDDLPGLERARGRRRAHLRGDHAGIPRRRRGPGAGAAAGRRGRVRPGPGHRARTALRPGAAGHGLHRGRTARAARRPRRRFRPAG